MEMTLNDVQQFGDSVAADVLTTVASRMVADALATRWQMNPVRTQADFEEFFKHNMMNFAKAVFEEMKE